MIRSTLGTLRFADLYFDEPSVPCQADIIRYVQCSSPVPGSECSPFSTRVLDLRSGEAELLSQMSSITRNSIRRAERAGLLYESDEAGSASSIGRFLEFYNRFAASKGLASLSSRRLEVLAANGCLDLSFVCEPGGDILSAAAYVRAARRLRLLYRPSLFRLAADAARRQFLSNANRYGIWLDILRAKRMGLEVYDLGGWYEGSSDTEKLGINNFKATFGGKVVHCYNCVLAVTWKGRAALFAARCRDRARLIRPGRRNPL